jgi:hypothetical protein
MPDQTARDVPYDLTPPPPPPAVRQQIAQMFQMENQLRRDVATRGREGWTREQWVAEAEEIMNDTYGSVTSLLNGHVMYLFEELHALRERDSWAPVDDEAAKGLLGESIHTGLRKGTDVPGAMPAHNAISHLEPEGWDGALQFAVDAMRMMGYEVCKKSVVVPTLKE